MNSEFFARDPVTSWSATQKRDSPWKEFLAAAINKSHIACYICPYNTALQPASPRMTRAMESCLCPAGIKISLLGRQYPLSYLDINLFAWDLRGG